MSGCTICIGFVCGFVSLEPYLFNVIEFEWKNGGVAGLFFLINFSYPTTKHLGRNYIRLFAVEGLEDILTDISETLQQR